MTISPLLLHLNKPQQQAVTTTEGPVIIFAGPGSGKTRVITHRIAYLIQERNVDPHRILAMTFTNKAAGELRERLASLLNDSRAKAVAASTFHSFCSRMLRREGDFLRRFRLTPEYVIYDRSDQLRLIKSCLQRVDLSDMQQLDATLKPAHILEALSYAKARMIDVDDLAAQARKDAERVAVRLWHPYHVGLRLSNAVDFDDLLLFFEFLLRTDPEARQKYQRWFHYIHVDEFQDCNLPQYNIMRYLAGSQGPQEEGLANVCVVGDDDQLIYAWRGASPENVVRFERDYPQAKAIFLEQNYRSTQSIIHAAQGIVKQIRNRKQKSIWTQNVAGDPVHTYMGRDDREEADFVASELLALKKQGVIHQWSEAAVLYRMNNMSRVLEERLRRRSIPYLVIGSNSFYDRKEIKDTLAYLRLIANPDDDASLLRVANVPQRRLGSVSLDALQKCAQQHDCSLYRAIERYMATDRGIKAGAKQALLGFHRLIAGLIMERSVLTLPELFDQVLLRSGYREELELPNNEDIDRWANVQELRRVTEEFADEDPETALQAFLEQCALVGSTETMQTSEQGVPISSPPRESVQLLTLHSAKGLEYPIVFIVGYAEGILPHSKSSDRSEQDEERRLAYVGLTRAMKRLYLTYAQERYVFGEVMNADASRFLDDIPPHLKIAVKTLR